MKFIIGLLLLLLFLNSTMIFVDGINASGYMTYVLYLAFFVLLIFYKKVVIRTNYIVLFILTFFVFFSTISSLINGDFALIITSVLLLLLYISLGSILPSLNINNEFISRIVLFSQIFLLFVPLLVEGIDRVPYSGIFGNPNAMGIVATTVLVVTISKVFVFLEYYLINNKEVRYVKTKLLFYTIISTLLLWLIMISSSRTSFIAAVLVATSGVLVMFYHVMRKKQLKTLAIKFPVLGIITIILIYILNKQFQLTYVFNETILSKFNAQSDDVLSGRGYIWKQTLSDAGLFGHGRFYFEDTFHIGPHNTFILILGQYGWIPFIFFGAFITIALIKTFKYSLVESNDSRYLPFLSVVGFIFLSMGEGLLYSSIMILMFAVIGVAINDKKIRIRK